MAFGSPITRGYLWRPLKMNRFSLLSMLRSASLSLLLALPLLHSCTSEPAAESSSPTSSHIMDPHSNARPDDAVITHMDLAVRVDMEQHRIAGTATYDLTVRDGAKTVILDTDDGLEVRAVRDAAGNELEFALGDSTQLGRALTVNLPKDVKRISIDYSTGPNAKALQWLAPQQTQGGKHPFLFTQGEAILSRSWFPVQDSPGIRFTYSAEVTVPKELMAVMSATNAQERNADGVYHFEMTHAIPAYLVALAVGDLAFKPMSGRTGVYAEPAILDKAAWEFEDTEAMLVAAEGLYGAYRWGRYDILVLPPSFPFGGMENPMLTFATPTIIAGDRSLTALIAHEMAHSWSGNLVTNATWNDFWLNEGFTVYFENRICEAVYGDAYGRMHHLLGHQDLQATIARLEKAGHPEDTHLRLSLEGRDPDDGMTDIAYEKGFAFLKYIESKVGRARFDVFLREYFDHFAFQNMTTDRFLDYLQTELLKPAGVTVDIAAWVDGPGLPADAIVPVSDRFDAVDAAVATWVAGTAATALPSANWTTHEWLHFLRHLPASISPAQMSELDNAFGLTRSGNAEVLAAWLDLSIANNYQPAFGQLEQFLTSVGRRKFLVPLYTRLATTDSGLELGRKIYTKARPNYHAVSVRTVDEILGRKEGSSLVMF